MADIPRDEFMRSIGLGGTAPLTNAAPVAAAPIAIAPATNAALNEQTRRLQQSQAAVGQREATAPRQDPDFATRLGARPGIPFDTQSGVSFMARLRTSAQPTPEEEIKALNAAYPNGNARRNDFGWLVVTKRDANGREQDVLVDPVGLDVGDFASVAGQIPEIAGAIATTIATRGTSMAPGILNAAKTLLAMVGGSAAGGATKDVLVRTAEGEPIQPAEIATRRGQQAAVDAALGTATGVGAKAIGMFVSPFSTTGPLQFEARKAQDYFAKKYGVKLDLTPAEATGNTFLQRAEAMESQKPGASVPFEALMKERETQLSELQRLALGGAVPDEEAAGQRALAALGSKVAPLEQNIERAAAATTAQATRELRAGTGAAVPRATVGESILTGARDARDAFEATNRANYDAFFNNPLAREPIIDSGGLKREIDSLLDDLPKVRQTQAQTSPIAGPTGAPIVNQVDVDVPVTTPVRPRLEELSAKLDGGRVSINDLKQIRTDVDNAIKTGEAIPGVKEGRLKTLYAKLTGAIEQGLTDINDPQLTSAWRTATDYYKQNVGRFEQKGIAELFRDPINAPGAVEVAERAMRSPDNYRAIKSFFGATSPQMRGIQQAVRDDVLGMDRLEGLVDARGFISRVTQLAKDAPEALDDAFGRAAAARLRNSARALSAAQGDTLPQAELVKAVNSGNLSAESLRDMLSAQAVKDAAYRNEIIRDVAKGNLAPDKIKPTEFVNRLVFRPTTQPQDVQGALALLQDRPDVLEDIRRSTFQKALDMATAVTPATGKRTIVANDLEQMLSDPQQVKRLQSALGSSTFEDLRQLTAFLKPGSAVQQAAKTAGGLSTGSQVAGLVERGALKYVDRAIKNFFIATVYTSPPIRALLTNTALEQQGKANLVNYVIASTPFLEAVTKEYGNEQARNVIMSLKSAVDQSVQNDPAQAELPPTREEFMRSIGAAADLNAAPVAP